MTARLARKSAEEITAYIPNSTVMSWAMTARSPVATDNAMRPRNVRRVAARPSMMPHASRNSDLNANSSATGALGKPVQQQHDRVDEGGVPGSDGFYDGQDYGQQRDAGQPEGQEDRWVGVERRSTGGEKGGQAGERLRQRPVGVDEVAAADLALLQHRRQRGDPGDVQVSPADLRDGRRRGQHGDHGQREAGAQDDAQLGGLSDRGYWPIHAGLRKLALVNVSRINARLPSVSL